VGEKLEERNVPSTATLAAGTLTVTGVAADERIRIFTDGTVIRVLDGTQVIGTFDPNAVTSIAVTTDSGNNSVIVDPNILVPVSINGGSGTNKFVGGGGSAVLSGAGRNAFFGGGGTNTFNATGTSNDLYNVMPTDVVFPSPNTRTLVALPPGMDPGAPQATITAGEANTLIQRAAAASASTDAIIVVTDRNGTILGVRVESGVSSSITSNMDNLVFAIDGAYALALTGAYFGNNNAPLTSRTIEDISQSTITQREVDSNPNITDPNSTLRGPGFVAPVGSKGHFPPGVANQPQVDLFQIEHTNRDQSDAPGPDGIVGTADDIARPSRFNIDPAFVPAGNALTIPDSYGRQSGLLPTAQSRGIGTLPGGIPIFKNGQSVGGIGVFFPGKTGFASEENSSLSATFNPALPDRSREAEWMAFAALGGAQVAVGSAPIFPVGTLSGVALPPGYGLPNGRIDLVGIQLDVFGQGGSVEGLQRVVQVGNVVGRGDPNNGIDMPVGVGPSGVAGGPDAVFFKDGKQVPTGWLVTPHDGVGITADQVKGIIMNGIVQSNTVRAAIRLPVGTRARFVFAVTDLQGNVVGLFREADATIFSIDVAVAKARNVAYYSNPAELQPIDTVPGLPAGAALTARTFRYLGEPRFPEAIDDNTLPGPFSQLNDDPTNTNRFTGIQTGPPAPASQYTSVVGHDAFNPGTNFHDPNNLLNQNGIVFFPGSSALYNNSVPGGSLIGGLGVSGDGVDQDDVTTVAAQSGFGAPLLIRADQFIVRGARLPYQKFNRNPEG
jgi:uncharacterized protein GlcG (DUF336 family)